MFDSWIHKPPLGYKVDPSHPLAPDHCWIFNEGSGSHVNNVGLTGNPYLGGSVVGPVEWVGSKDGSALGFSSDITTDYVEVPSDARFMGKLSPSRGNWTYLTVSAPTSNPSALGTLLSRGSTAASGHHLQIQPTGGSSVDRGASGSGGIFLNINNNWFGDDTDIRDTGLRFWGGTRRISGAVQGHFDLYLDGAVVQAAMVSNNGEHLENTTARIGMSSISGAAAPWDGAISWIMAWNTRALSPGDVNSIYMNPFQVFYPPVNPVVFMDLGAPPAGLSIPVAMNHYRRQQLNPW